eukprot:CAMPEP_0184490284 /NCGR_PEP_ID=MMETSP0113_2-20130426/17465_1 /TAXON_ID=91329 /ORGANISM="Norrisiella sphaerica, Strain BC52" /LENGTH=353 /DNA_ID=CAMNT_0026874081 /DNA_START=196 /DNA_END=1258 /DNA_ORIENTATION=+
MAAFTGSRQTKSIAGRKPDIRVVMIACSLLWLVACPVTVTAETVDDQGRKGSAGRRFRNGLRKARGVALGSFKATGRLFRFVRKGIAEARERRRRRLIQRKHAGENDKEDFPEDWGAGAGGKGGLMCGLLRCLCCCSSKNRLACLSGGGPNIRAAFDCILPRSLWYPNTPSSMSSMFKLPNLFDYADANLTLEEPPSERGFKGRWVKTAQINQNWALAALGYTKFQRSIIERARLPLHLELSNTTFRVRTQGFRSFHTSYPLDGREISYPRRDGRPGSCRARVLAYTNVSLTLSLDWDQPYGGTNIQTYKLQTSNTDAPEAEYLLIENRIRVRAKDPEDGLSEEVDHMSNSSG